MKLKTFTIDDIRQLEPCYDPAKYLPEDWTGTALDILQVIDCLPQDRLWVVCHEGWIDDRTLRLFAVWCARQALSLIDNPDPRSVAACNVAERYANGRASNEELAAARDAAWGATNGAARGAVLAAASKAASNAAGGAAWGVAWATAWAGAGWLDYSQVGEGAALRQAGVQCAVCAYQPETDLS
jgi:hypothetical protein